MNTIELNTSVLEQELNWFSKVLDTRLKIYFDHECEYASIEEIAPPVYEEDTTFYSRFIKYYEIDFAERVVLILSLIPHVKPKLLDVFLSKNNTYDREFTEFGGARILSQTGFIPTGETALFILAGEDLEKRFSLMRLFDGDHFFVRHNILTLQPAGEGNSVLSGALKLHQEYIDYFTTGRSRKPNFGIDFPAKLISTKLNWADLILPHETLEHIEEIKAWIDHGDTLMIDWGLGNKLRPGYRSLFHGPSGTGKTLTACLLGKYCGRDVYRIDLSLVISKYIGETEKNLSKVFDMAENKNWILFFDEADALFGKRTKIDDAQDKYANQEVSYLLQRIEDFNGVVILASNFKANLDEAFTRRFQSLVFFPMPKPAERLKLWEKAFSPASTFEEKISLQSFANKYELTGGAIMNVVRYCSLMALRRGENIIRLNDIEEGIKKEYQKEGRTI